MMDIITTILLFSLSGLVLLAASPFLVYKLGKNVFRNMFKPYERFINHIQASEHRYASFFKEIEKQYFITEWIRSKKISNETIALFLAFKPHQERISILRSLPQERIEQIDRMMRKTKKVKDVVWEQCFMEIRSLLEVEVKQQQASKDMLLFYYYDDLYEDIHFVREKSKVASYIIQQQVQQITEKTLSLLPTFQALQLYEESHKFTTLIKKDLRESLSLLQHINDEDKTEKETQMFVVLKSILNDMQEMEGNIKNAQKNELTKKMRVLEDKFQIHLDEE